MANKLCLVYQHSHRGTAQYPRIAQTNGKLDKLHRFQLVTSQVCRTPNYGINPLSVASCFNVAIPFVVMMLS